MTSSPDRPPSPKDEPEIVGPASPPASHALKPHRPPGLYEELVTRRLDAALEEIRGAGWRDEITNLDPAEAPGVLARFVHDLVEPLLGSLTGDDRTARQLEIVNNLVDHLQSAVKDSPVIDDDALAPPARQLLSLVDPALHGVGEATAPLRPSIPLASSHLLINGPRDHTVSSEIKRVFGARRNILNFVVICSCREEGWRRGACKENKVKKVSPGTALRLTEGPAAFARHLRKMPGSGR